MALTAMKTTALVDKGFDGLYSGNKALWFQKAKDAHDYAVHWVEPTREPVRTDDVLVNLEPAVEVAPEFRHHLDEQRLTQKYWRTYFSEYILDQVWSRL